MMYRKIDLKWTIPSEDNVATMLKRAEAPLTCLRYKMADMRMTIKTPPTCHYHKMAAETPLTCLRHKMADAVWAVYISRVQFEGRR